MITVIVHINNEDPVMGEIEELPKPSDQTIMLKHPRRKDGKDVHYLEQNVNLVILIICPVELFVQHVEGKGK